MTMLRSILLGALGAALLVGGLVAVDAQTPGGLVFATRIRMDSGPSVTAGSGDPESSVTASPGSLYFRTDGTIYRKASGTGNTGWSATGGDVSAAAVITDHAIVRGDGGAKGVQESLLTLDDTGVVAWPDGVKQTFNPDATTAGFNVGSQAGDPSSPANGDLWYDSSANELTAYINSAAVALGAGGGGGGSVGAVDVARLERATNGLAVYSGLAVTEDDTGASMDVDVAAGHIRTAAGIGVLVTAAEVTLDTADGSNPRIDLVHVTTAGTLGETAGTPAADPVPPTLPANTVLLAQVSVPAGDTTIETAQITDARTYTKLPQVIRKPATESVSSSTTPQDDDDLTFTIGASEVWQYEFAIVAGSTSNTPDLTWQLTVPSGATPAGIAFGQITATTGLQSDLWMTTRQDTAVPQGNVGIWSDSSWGTGLPIRGTIENSTTAGNVTFQWAQNTSNATATQVIEGSYLLATPITLP